MHRGNALDARSRRFITRDAKLGGRISSSQDREAHESHHLLKLRTTCYVWHRNWCAPDGVDIDGSMRYQIGIDTLWTRQTMVRRQSPKAYGAALILVAFWAAHNAQASQDLFDIEGLGPRRVSPIGGRRGGLLWVRGLLRGWGRLG